MGYGDSRAEYGFSAFDNELARRIQRMSAFDLLDCELEDMALRPDSPTVERILDAYQSDIEGDDDLYFMHVDHMRSAIRSVMGAACLYAELCREYFSVGEDETGKYIDYHGFVWERDPGNAYERGSDGEVLGYAYTHGKLGRVYLGDIGGDPFEHVMGRFDVCQQHQRDMSRRQACELLCSFYCGAAGTRLHMSDVRDDTPCGDYFFDNGVDEPREEGGIGD